MWKSSNERLYASFLIVGKACFICATGKLVYAVVAAQKIVIPKEKLMAICYWI
jgi:hypothetical protein